MVFFKKKTVKNKVETFDNGQKQEEPELKVPLPPDEPAFRIDPPEEFHKTETTPQPQQVDAQVFFDEGWRVGFQEGVIHSLKTLEEELQRIQDELRKKIAERREVVK